MKNKKVFGIVSLVLSLLPVASLLYAAPSLNGEMIFIGVLLALAVVGLVLGFIGVKEAKGLSIAGIVISILMILYLLVMLIGLNGFAQAKNCVEKDDGTATCELVGETVEGIPVDYLRDDQMKKEDK